jgi:EAL domain-containing protein (putative c-di-GMP-specific phosphodiesterase class I)
VVSDPDLAHEVAIQLKLYNIGVAIDDFGSGYATLERVRALPFSELKTRPYQGARLCEFART